MDYLDNDIKFVGGVGEARARLLDKELGIRTLGDMLRHYPFRYIDRTKVYRIAEITDDAPTLLQFRARVTGVAYAGTGRKRRFTAYVSDPTGSAELVWFQGIKWIEKRVEVGREYLIFGRPSFYRGELSMAHPELETMEQALSRKAESGMQGIYPSTEKLSNVLGAKGMYQIICNAWALAKDHIPDYMPDEVRTRYGLIPLRDAYYNIHFPQSPELLRQAQYRLKFDELLGIQLNVQSRRTERLAKNNGFLFMKVGGVFNTFYNEKLPFPLTGAQKRVIREIRRDTVTGFQMNRLLQGDVGSGKTLVALMSMLLAVDNGYQACMMAPTEILARQHFATITRMLDGMGVKVAILTGASKARERRLALEGIASGEVHILIGTHALIEDRVQFANLGFVVIDEQHRFGVEQRAALAESAASQLKCRIEEVPARISSLQAEEARLRSKLANNPFFSSASNFFQFLRWMLISTLTGLVVGSVSTIFNFGLKFAVDFRHAHLWVVLFLPVAGLAIVFLYRFFHYENNAGTDTVINSIHKEAHIPLRMSFLIFVSTILTVLCGGSVGREGAAMQIGGSIGEQIGEKLRFNEKDKKIMLMSGISAAFSALFGTPMAAAFLAMEIASIGIMYYAALVPCIWASLTAYMLAKAFHAPFENLAISSDVMLNLGGSARVILLAVLCAFVSILFCKTMHVIKALYARFFPNPFVRAFTGGVIIILLSLLLQSLLLSMSYQRFRLIKMYDE